MIQSRLLKDNLKTLRWGIKMVIKRILLFFIAAAIICSGLAALGLVSTTKVNKTLINQLKSTCRLQRI